MWMRRRALLLLLPLLTACTPPGQDRQVWLSQFVGRPEVELINAMGVPTRSYETDGTKFLAFTESRLDVVAPLSLYGSPYWGLSPNYGVPPIVQWYCETTVVVSGGLVRNFSFRGNAC